MIDDTRLQVSNSTALDTVVAGDELHASGSALVRATLLVDACHCLSAVLHHFDSFYSLLCFSCQQAVARACPLAGALVVLLLLA
jgi:hypothetical protein